MRRRTPSRTEAGLRARSGAEKIRAPARSRTGGARADRLAALQAEAAGLRRELAAEQAAWRQRFAQEDQLHRIQLREQERRLRDALERREQEWQGEQARQRLREFARAVLPPGARVLVVSKGDDELLRLDGRLGWHFPQAPGGVYAGHHPADSAEAIAHLEALRAKGAGYLLIPAWAFWWLNYYADFRRHLETRYRLAAFAPDRCLIFRLSASPSEGRERPGLRLIGRQHAAADTA